MTENTRAITGREDIIMAGLIGARGFMILEIKTGMKKNSRQNFFQECRTLGISAQRSKKGVLNDLEKHMKSLGWKGEFTTWD